MLKLLTIVAGIAMSISYFMQAWHIWKRKSSDDISLLTYVILSTGSATWLLYGIVEKNAVIILGYVLGVFGTLLVLSLSIYYRKKS